MSRALAALLTVPLLFAGAAAALLLAPERGNGSRYAGCVPASLPPDESPALRPGQRLETVEEAAAFVCHDVPYPRLTLGFQGPIVSAVPAGGGDDNRPASATLVYFDGSRSFILEVSRADPARPGDRIAETLRLNGAEVRLLDVPDVQVAYWHRDGLYAIALAQDLERDDFLAMVESIE